MTLKLKRVATGSYETADGCYSIFRDPTRMAGFFGGCWHVSKWSGIIATESTLKEARTWLEKHIAKGIKS